jgi:hypothetical protein
VNGGLLELVDQPASVGIFADDLPAIIMLRLRAITRFCEFEPQPSGYAARRDIGRATGSPKTKNKGCHREANDWNAGWRSTPSEAKSRWIAYHAEMARKYEHAAQYPWLTIKPDPPEPPPGE